MIANIARLVQIFIEVVMETVTITGVVKMVLEFAPHGDVNIGMLFVLFEARAYLKLVMMFDFKIIVFDMEIIMILII